MLNKRGMYARKYRFACAAVLLAGLYSAAALTTIAPVLTNATWSGDQFQFTLLGETNVAYILESSSNLRNWTRALTNSDPQTTRTITAPATNAQTFWRVRPVPSPLFEYAVLAQGNVNLSGSGWINSFDSADPNYSNPIGRYDPTKQKAGGHVATASRTPIAINVGNTKVAGLVSTGPGASVLVGPNGGVGSLPWFLNPAYGGTIEPGYLSNTFRVVLPRPTLPTNFGPVLPLPQYILYPPMIGGTNYKYAILQDGDYRFPGDLSLGSGEKMLIDAKARLHILGNTTVSGSGYILLGPNASIEWYASGAVNIGGGGFINDSGRATNFSIFVFNAVPVTYSGIAPFIGTTYAPFSPVTLSGTSDAIGAIVCTNFTLTGSMGVHFDESLKSAGPFY